MDLHTGSRDGYYWLTSDEHNLADLMRFCPATALDRCLAITAIDSASLEVTEEERTAGWETRKKIAYSPRVKSIASLPHENRHGWCVGFDEWYVFDAPADLGECSHGNIFEAPFKPGRVEVFVAYFGFILHDPTMQAITDLFWKQMELIQPESYIADGDTYLTFVTRNKDLFRAVQEELTRAAG